MKAATTPPIDTEIARLMQESRERTGLSQEEIGKALGVSRNPITMGERGKSLPHFSNASTIPRNCKIDEADVISAIMATKFSGLGSRGLIA